MSVTLRQLRAFVTVGQLGSFVEAARAMHVSASALSILIGELESALGLRVLDRTTRRVRVSAAGEQYLPYAQRVLEDLESAERCARDLRSPKTGVVRIATSQVIAWTLMPRVFAAFRALRPDVQIEPLDLAMDQVLPSLQANRADLAITLHSEVSSELHSMPVFGSRVYLACRVDHRWAGRKRLAWAELPGEPLIFTGAETPQRINAALPDGPMVKGVRQVEHAGSALALVAGGFGSAICAGYVHSMSGMHNLRFVELVRPTVVRPFSVYFSSRRALPPVVEGFREFLIASFTKPEHQYVEERQDG